MHKSIKANAQASATVTAVVTGTDSEGNTGQSFGTYTVKIPVTIEGGDGLNGDRGEKVITALCITRQLSQVHLVYLQHLY